MAIVPLIQARNTFVTSVYIPTSAVDLLSVAGYQWKNNITIKMKVIIT